MSKRKLEADGPGIEWRNQAIPYRGYYEGQPLKIKLLAKETLTWEDLPQESRVMVGSLYALDLLMFRDVEAQQLIMLFRTTAYLFPAYLKGRCITLYGYSYHNIIISLAHSHDVPRKGFLDVFTKDPYSMGDLSIMYYNVSSRGIHMDHHNITSGEDWLNISFGLGREEYDELLEKSFLLASTFPIEIPMELYGYIKSFLFALL